MSSVSGLESEQLIQPCRFNAYQASSDMDESQFWRGSAYIVDIITASCFLLETVMTSTIYAEPSQTGVYFIATNAVYC